MRARTSKTRGKYARQGLATKAALDATTHAMLLRQLYLSLFEEREFGRAQMVALQAVELSVLSDVIHQDVARAALAQGDLELGLSHLRLAARQGPASRRAFHWWTLGSTLFLVQRYDEAAAALSRAARWGTRDKPLYRAHLALVRIAHGERPDDITDLVRALADAPCGQGYGRFVLGHLAYASGAWKEARKYLDLFVRRIEAARPSISIALEGELGMARATLQKMSAN